MLAGVARLRRRMKRNFLLQVTNEMNEIFRRWSNRSTFVYYLEVCVRFKSKPANLIHLSKFSSEKLIFIHSLINVRLLIFQCYHLLKNSGTKIVLLFHSFPHFIHAHPRKSSFFNPSLLSTIPVKSFLNYTRMHKIHEIT